MARGPPLDVLIAPQIYTKSGNNATWNPVAFSSCQSLISITIPNSVTSIGIYTFSGCTSLSSITIPNGTTRISEYAFNECNS
ncbi:MAG: leucine-rich repeat domain-containing protein, partial [Peptococcaceae bacterium]|nr:leucine-rich repeat domain-containing protein [Peptococcaceae bacterium]